MVNHRKNWILAVALLAAGVVAGCSQRDKFVLHEYKVKFTGDGGAVAECTVTQVQKGISSTSTATITSPSEQIILAEALRVELNTTSQPVRKNFTLELVTDGQSIGKVDGYVGPGASGKCALADGISSATQPGK